MKSKRPSLACSSPPPGRKLPYVSCLPLSLLFILLSLPSSLPQSSSLPVGIGYPLGLRTASSFASEYGTFNSSFASSFLFPSNDWLPPSYSGINYDYALPRRVSDSSIYQRCKDTHRCNQGIQRYSVVNASYRFTHTFFRNGIENPVHTFLDFETWEAGTTGVATNPAYLQNNPLQSHGGGHFNSFWTETNAILQPIPLHLNHSCTIEINTDTLLFTVICDASPLLPMLNTTIYVNETRLFRHFTGAKGYKDFTVVSRNATAVNITYPHPRWTWLREYTPSPAPDLNYTDPYVIINCTDGYSYSYKGGYDYVSPINRYPNTMEKNHPDYDDSTTPSPDDDPYGSLYGAQDPTTAAYSGRNDQGLYGRGGIAAGLCNPGETYTYSRNFTGTKFYTRRSSGRRSMLRTFEEEEEIDRQARANGTTVGIGVPVAVFHFPSIFLGPAVKILTRGSLPLVLLSRSAVYLDTSIDITPGTLGGFTGSRGPLATHTNTLGPGSSTTRTYTFTVTIGGDKVPEIQEITTRVDEGQTLRGTWALTFRNSTTSRLPPDAEPATVAKAIMASFRTVGNVTVTRTAVPVEGGYTWQITFLSAVGNQPSFVPVNYLTGIGARISVRTVQKGNELDGNFTLAWRNQLTAPIPVNSTAQTVHDTILRAWGKSVGVLHAYVSRSDPLNSRSTLACSYLVPQIRGPGPSYSTVEYPYGSRDGVLIGDDPRTIDTIVSTTTTTNVQRKWLRSGSGNTQTGSLDMSSEITTGNTENEVSTSSVGLNDNDISLSKLGARSGKGSSGLGFGCVNGPGPAYGLVWTITLVTHVGVVEDVYPTSSVLINDYATLRERENNLTMNGFGLPYVYPPRNMSLWNFTNIYGTPNPFNVSLPYAPLFSSPDQVCRTVYLNRTLNTTTTVCRRNTRKGPLPFYSQDTVPLYPILSGIFGGRSLYTAGTRIPEVLSTSQTVFRTYPPDTVSIDGTNIVGTHPFYAVSLGRWSSEATGLPTHNWIRYGDSYSGTNTTIEQVLAYNGTVVDASYSSLFNSYGWLTFSQHYLALQKNFSLTNPVYNYNWNDDNGIGGLGSDKSLADDVFFASYFMRSAGLDPFTGASSTSPLSSSSSSYSSSFLRSDGTLLPFPSFFDTSSWCVTSSYGGNGGSYGGIGGDGHAPHRSRRPYGDATLSDLLGGSGGSIGGSTLAEMLTHTSRPSGSGGSGGGAIEIIAVTDLILGRHARISVNGSAGEDGYRGGGGGSGGSILLSAGQAILLLGELHAQGGNGGMGTGSGSRGGGGGSGGRIAAFAQAINVIEPRDGKIFVNGGFGGWDESDILLSSRIFSSRTLQAILNNPNLLLPKPSPAVLTHPSFNGRLRNNRESIDGEAGTISMVSGSGTSFAVDSNYGGGAEDTRRALRVSSVLPSSLPAEHWIHLFMNPWYPEKYTFRKHHNYQGTAWYAGLGGSNSPYTRNYAGTLGIDGPGDLPYPGTNKQYVPNGHQGPWIMLSPSEMNGEWYLRKGIPQDIYYTAKITVPLPNTSILDETVAAIVSNGNNNPYGGGGGSGGYGYYGNNNNNNNGYGDPNANATVEDTEGTGRGVENFGWTKPRPERITVYVRTAPSPVGLTTAQYGFQIALHDDPWHAWPTDVDMAEETVRQALQPFIQTAIDTLVNLWEKEAKQRAEKLRLEDALFIDDPYAPGANVVNLNTVTDPYDSGATFMPVWDLPSSFVVNASVFLRDGNWLGLYDYNQTSLMKRMNEDRTNEDLQRYYRQDIYVQGSTVVDMPAHLLAVVQGNGHEGITHPATMQFIRATSGNHPDIQQRNRNDYHRYPYSSVVSLPHSIVAQNSGRFSHRYGLLNDITDKDIHSDLRTRYAYDDEETRYWYNVLGSDRYVLEIIQQSIERKRNANPTNYGNNESTEDVLPFPWNRTYSRDGEYESMPDPAQLFVYWESITSSSSSTVPVYNESDFTSDEYAKLGTYAQLGRALLAIRQNTLPFSILARALKLALLRASTETILTWYMSGGALHGGPGGPNGIGLLPFNPSDPLLIARAIRKSMHESLRSSSATSTPDNGGTAEAHGNDANVMIGLGAVNGRWAHGANYRHTPGLDLHQGQGGSANPSKLGPTTDPTTTASTSHARTSSFPSASLTSPGPRPYQWYKLDIFIDWHNHTYKLRIDDTTVILDQSFTGEGVTRIGLYVFDQSTVWFDEIYAGPDDTLGFECPIAEEEGKRLRMQRPMESTWKTNEIGGQSQTWGIIRHDSHISKREMYVHELHAGLVYGDGEPHRRFFVDLTSRTEDTSEGEVLAGSLLYVRGDQPVPAIRYAAQTVGLIDGTEDEEREGGGRINQAQRSEGLVLADPYGPVTKQYRSITSSASSPVIPEINQGILLGTGIRTTDTLNGEWTNGDILNQDTSERGPYGGYRGNTGRNYWYGEHDYHRYYAFQRDPSLFSGGSNGGGGGDGGGGGGITDDDPYATDDDPYATDDDPYGMNSGGGGIRRRRQLTDSGNGVEHYEPLFSSEYFGTPNPSTDTDAVSTRRNRIVFTSRRLHNNHIPYDSPWDTVPSLSSSDPSTDNTTTVRNRTYPLPSRYIESRSWYAGGIGACSSSDMGGSSWRNEGIVLFYANITNTGNYTTVSTRNYTSMFALNNTVYREDGTLAYRGERPKVLHNLNTETEVQRRHSSTLFAQEYPQNGETYVYNDYNGAYFTMWMATDDYAKTKLMVGIATALYPSGPFYFQHTLRPDTNETTDFTLLQDDDTGYAYLVRTYYQSIDYYLPRPIMQPIWESVKNGDDGSTNFPLTFHRAYYHTGYDNPDDIWKQRWRLEDIPWNITTGDYSETFDYELHLFTLLRLSTNEIIAQYAPVDRQKYLDMYLDKYTFRNITGQAQLLVTTRYQDPFRPEFSSWVPSSVPAVKAQPWQYNYKEKNIVDNPPHPTVADLLIGPNQVIETRRTKYIAVSGLTADYLNTTGVLTVIEGTTEKNDNLLVLLSEYGRFGWAGANDGHDGSESDGEFTKKDNLAKLFVNRTLTNNSSPQIHTFVTEPYNATSTYEPDIYGRVEPFYFDTEVDWEDRFWQYNETYNDRAYDFRNFRDRQTDNKCQDIHHRVLIKHAECQTIMNNDLKYVLSPPQKNYQEIQTSYSYVMDTSKYENCLAEHETILEEYQTCIRSRVPNLEAIPEWNVGARDCIGGGGICGPPATGLKPNATYGFQPFDPTVYGLPVDAYEPDRTQINASTGNQSIVPSYYGTSLGANESRRSARRRRLNPEEGEEEKEDKGMVDTIKNLFPSNGNPWTDETDEPRSTETDPSVPDETWTDQEKLLYEFLRTKNGEGEG